MMNKQKIKESFSYMHASEDTVAEVLKMAKEQDEKKTRRHPVRTGVLIGLAAVLLIGSAFAAVTYKLRADQFGELAVAISVTEEGSAPGTVAFSGEASDSVTFTSLLVTPGWLPEGMVLQTAETDKWTFEDNWGKGGFSLGYFPLNTENATFCDVVTDAERQVTFEIGGHEAIYVKSASEGFNQYMFISYPEYNAVLKIWIGADVDLDTAKRFAENLTVTAGDQEMDAETLEYNGKRYLDTANFIATGVYVNAADEEDGMLTAEEMEAILAERDPANNAVKSGMADAHEIGESFAVSFLDFSGGHKDGPFVDLTVKVTDISVRDDYSALRDLQYLDQDWAGRVDENGKLPKADYEFVLRGDGVNTPGATVVATLPDQQLYMVAATVEITNDTDETVKYAGYYGRLLSIAETADGWAVTEPIPEDSTVEFDESYCTGGSRLNDLRYWDLKAEINGGGNAICDLAPGESVTIQMGFIVSECQLGDLWFFMNDMDVEGVDDLCVGYVPVP